MRVLLTGGSGFTGHHLVSKLHANNAEVFALGIAKAPGADSNLIADLNDFDSIHAWLRDIRPTHVIHLAALSHVIGDPTTFYNVNVVGSETLISAAVASHAPIEHFVVASTANLYGNAVHSPITEATAIRPMNHYATSKAAMELMLRRFSDALSISVARPFNYTGPGQSEAFVFGKIAGAFRRREAVLSLGNIDVARDVSDVRDVCEVYWRLLQRRTDGEPVNICSGRAIDLGSAISILAKQTGHSPQIAIDPALVRANEIKSLVGDPSRLRSLVGSWDWISLERTLADMVAT